MTLLIDVRDPEEYAEHHLSGAKNLPVLAILYSNLGFLEDVPKDVEIALYCQSGGRSERAKQALLQAGFTNVTNLGGIADAEQE